MGSALEPTSQPATDAATARRPVWVWIITIFYVFSIGGSTLALLALRLSGSIPLTPAQQSYYSGFGEFDFIPSMGLGLLTLAATVLLFLLKEQAVPVFATSFVLTSAVTVVHTVRTPDWTAALSGAGLVGVLLGWVTLGAVVLYSRRLRRAGVLR